MSEILPIKYKGQNQLYREKKEDIFVDTLLLHFNFKLTLTSVYVHLLNIGEETTREVKSSRVNAGDTVL